jgi:hypothetical protein
VALIRGGAGVRDRRRRPPGICHGVAPLRRRTVAEEPTVHLFGHGSVRPGDGIPLRSSSTASAREAQGSPFLPPAGLVILELRTTGECEASARANRVDALPQYRTPSSGSNVVRQPRPGKRMKLGMIIPAPPRPSSCALAADSWNRTGTHSSRQGLDRIEDRHSTPINLRPRYWMPGAIPACGAVETADSEVRDLSFRRSRTITDRSRLANITMDNRARTKKELVVITQGQDGQDERRLRSRCWQAKPLGLRWGGRPTGSPRRSPGAMCGIDGT